MVNNFDAALSSLLREQPLDHFAHLAAMFLEAAAVAIVDVEDGPSLLGASDAVASMSALTLNAARAVVPAPAETLTSASSTLRGVALGPPHDDCRVVNVVIGRGSAELLGMVFLGPDGVESRKLARFVAMAERHLSQQSLMRRYRCDLKRYIGMFHQMERIAEIGVWEFDIATGTIEWSDGVFRIHDLSEGDVPAVDEALTYYPEPGRTRLAEALHELAQSGRPIDLTLPFVTAADRRRTVRVIARMSSGADGGQRFAGVLQDVTAQHEATEQLWWTANHDALTGLPNRALFNDRFRTALERSRRNGKLLCLVLVDVDNFKVVNDTLGHQAGDELLRMVARQLAANVRSNDTVARTGGDEFSILVEDIADLRALEVVLERLQGGLQTRLAWQERTMTINLSAGAAVAPEHGRTERELLSAADLALYRRKSDPQPALTLYRSAFGRAAVERSRMLAEARAALSQGRFVPYFQPQLDLATGKIVAVEALARWITDRGVLHAGDFGYAIADEEIGPMIGDELVRTAFSQMALLNEGRADKICLSINTSASEVVGARFLDKLEELNDTFGPDAVPVTVEITEDVILDDPEGELVRQLEAAANRGIKFALDDFGTGYASLIHIARLPIAEVKVDRSFITDVETDISKQKIVGSIIEMAQSLGLRVIIEGVETAAQVRLVRELGAQYVQGYYYAPALPLAELTALIDSKDASALAACPRGSSAPLVETMARPAA